MLENLCLKYKYRHYTALFVTFKTKAELDCILVVKGIAAIRLVFCDILLTTKRWFVFVELGLKFYNAL